MINYKNAEKYLKDLINKDLPDVKNVWEIFKSFGREQVEGEEEVALLFQCGVYDFTGEKLFYFDFVRQFSIEEDGHMEQLHCEFVFNPTEELKKLETSEWYFDYEGEIENFYRNIENMKEFQIPMNSKPIRFNLYQEEV